MIIRRLGLINGSGVDSPAVGAALDCLASRAHLRAQSVENANYSFAAMLVSPRKDWCREGESNPHARKGHQILSLVEGEDDRSGTVSDHPAPSHESATPGP